MYNYDSDFIDVSKRLSFTDDEVLELYPHIDDILKHEKWELMRRYRHHLESRAVHCLEVCCVAWRRAKKMPKCDEASVAIGGLLHDFFLYDWQSEKPTLDDLDIKRRVYTPKMHGFIHPLIALNNAYRYFPQLMNEKIEDIILKHMWPLTVNPPRCREAWLVCLTDKSCSLNVFKAPRELPRYIGIKKKSNN